MSLVTRCPACTTTFKVVRDQLRISDGWVRCGRCSNVFDATLDLHETGDGSPAPVQGSGYMPGLVEQQPAPESAPPASLPEPPIEEKEPAPAASTTEDADFFDDEPEHQHRSREEEDLLPPDALVLAPAPAVVSPPAQDRPPPPPSAPLPAFSLTLPEHGIAADEPWSDLDVSEPAWRPPPSTLPPFPNIDLNLAAPPPAPPPPAPPLPVASRAKATTMRTLIERASDEGEDAERERAREQQEKEHDQVQMQKALRRARAKSAKIASAKAREERVAAQAPAIVVQAESEPELNARASDFELPVGHPFADEDDSAEKPTGFWQRKGVRVVLVLLVVLAALLLVLQIIHHERDGIVARQPNLRPALAALCQYTGCELGALRQIGDIVIEGAAFAREKSGGNDYRLSFTLRNGATVPLAMPAVELSLLDTQERAVVRRVLMPADYGAPAVLAARADRAASLPLSLSASEAAALPPVAGYRVEAFYP
ncbi:DUF3426 domain-containing protein [Variovorax sp. NFACC27]|uniref:zinc-ribbon and DUF3426 domain-containing protein n=1 Tax=unclassified Variovorax TaxID=663243 RepID=UPI000898CB47|nr:DUF3426 domain-containing protein [Variovorax sp. YR750]SEF20494.1 MJ0042 family finger-like domain-containing protein [Variovorax sp. NFACC28]SEF57865.1 MJ0042 family finger-like domain-containing protein [Variovorax sp. NFACC29]SFB71327.1 MJ0042 family finger-like domain-containing protein [Variovorax sp. NFACC26]SFG57779.1 MJ0042 family finger-like domain-containing protein [Variovorax sp. NFACC27]SEK89760.1 MJ0042 family finger-like domain-containing protein [Variovorax sp. YR750]